MFCQEEGKPFLHPGSCPCGIRDYGNDGNAFLFPGGTYKIKYENNPHIGITPQSEGDFIHLHRYISARIAEKEGVVAVFPESA
jgi:hypothetical protein